MTDTNPRDLIQRLADMADALDCRKPLVFAQGRAMDGFTALANFQALANEARAYLAQPEPGESAKYDEDHWRKDALEKLIYAAQHFRLGVYSAEELEIFENRGRAVLARWPRAAIKPVPVSERLPGPEDCDAEGRCWWWDDDDDKWCLHEHSPRILCWTHWRPYYALPVPTTITETP